MKKQLLFLFFALLALCASAAVGDNFTNGKLRYEVMSNGTSTDYGTVAVKGLSSEGASYSSLDLQIPGLVTYNGASYKVVKVWASAFNGSSNLTYVQMLYGMEDVSVAAFRNCTKLLSVKLPSSVKVIRKNAFENCRVLRSVYYANPTPDNSTIDETAFPNNSSMQLIVPLTDANSVENAKKVTAFNKFSNIYAHHQASDFMFDNGAAYCCVTKAPANKNVSGEFSIVGIDPLNLVFSPTSSSENVVGYKFNYATIADGAYASKSLKTVDLSKLDYLRMVGKSAFEDCKALTSVQLSMNLINIRPYAFSNCTSLKYITLPASVRECSAYFVDGCSNLQDISVVSTNKYYASNLGILYNKDFTKLIRCPEGFMYAKLLYHNFFPPALKTIGPYAFENCKLIKSIYLPYGTTGFGRDAFNRCTSLTTIKIPSTCKDWGDDAFRGATALDTMYVNLETAPNISQDYFRDCKKGRLYMRVTESGNSYIKDPWLWGLQTPGAFDVLSTTQFKPESYRYTLLGEKEQTLNGLKYGGIAMLAYVPPIATADNLSIRVPKYVGVNGVRYAITAIGSQICSDGLKSEVSLILGEFVEDIQSYALADQPNLTAIRFNPNLKSIGLGAFKNCRIASAINLPYGFTTLGALAFSDNALQIIRIPSSIKSISGQFISNNKNLQEIVLNSPEFSGQTYWNLTGIPTSCKLYVPVGSAEAYRKNVAWGKLNVTEGSYDFTLNASSPHKTKYHITVTSSTPLTVDGVTYAGKAKYVYHPANKDMTYYLFESDSYVINVTHGAYKKYLVTEFGDRALENCTNLTEVKLDKMKHLERIGRRAFYSSGIKEFTVPSTCTYIGVMAFTSCKSLTDLVLLNNEKRTWGGQFYGQNANGFTCYVPWRSYYKYQSSISNWQKYVGDTNMPIDRLNAFVCVDNGAPTYSFSVPHPVDWEASGLNAYTVYGYDKAKRQVNTLRMGRTLAGEGLLIDGYSQNTVYKLKRPATLPSQPTNLLVGTNLETVNVYDKKVGFLFSPSSKYFWRPSNNYNLVQGMAYLLLSATDAGSTERIYVDRWSKATGDINGDGEVNVSDVTALINKILGSSTYSDAVCDINGDGEINVSDVTALINLILK